MNQIKISKKNSGFTMIEMLVSVAIFSIVITMIMGTITTIVDASRKARTMTEVMNNLNFGFESMTRTIKTGTNISVTPNEISAKDQKGRTITYSFSNENGITKQVDGASAESITSNDLKLISWSIEKIYSGSDQNFITGGYQPRVFFSVKGRVETAKGISSEFTLQSTVSQRQLELGN